MTTSEPIHAYLKNIANSKRIHDSPLNLSPTKMQYSFPHASRFNCINRKPTANVPFYEVDSKVLKTIRACSLGKGSKYDFTKNYKHVPAPNCYFPKNLSISASVKHGYSFGVARELAPQNGILFVSKSSGAKPGPASYNPQLPKSESTVTFRIKTRRTNHENVEIGPGKYNISSTFEPCKNIYNSKFKNTISIKIPPLKDNPSACSAKVILGEHSNGSLQCDLKHQINKTGVFYNAKYHNSMCRSFGKAEKEQKTKNLNNPGPGAYFLPSEFGLYQSSEAI